ncbi:MAG: RNA 2',3'-cyclic phosphodiesterase [Methylovulum sp.]
MSEYSRLFFALWPDNNTRRQLAQLSDSIQLNAFKLVHPQNLHVTLVYLGHVDKDVEMLIKQAAAGISARPFELQFDQLSYWQRAKVLCLTCQQPADEVCELAATLALAATNLGLQLDKRPYIPHITLARGDAAVAGYSGSPIVWRAESFCLVKSCSEPDGVRYQVIQQWPLVKATE